jgi:two-component system, chemotaxis family, CheB/CheR fusion protein
MFPGDSLLKKDPHPSLRSGIGRHLSADRRGWRKLRLDFRSFRSSASARRPEALALSDDIMIGVTACFLNVPILILSRDLRIRRFTPTATTVLNVIASDIGHPIGDITLNIHVADLSAMLADSIDSMSVKEREVQDRKGHWYALRIRPYRTLDDRIDGAVLVLINIDDLKRTLPKRCFKPRRPKSRAST